MYVYIHIYTYIYIHIHKYMYININIQTHPRRCPGARPRNSTETLNPHPPPHPPNQPIPPCPFKRDERSQPSTSEHNSLSFSLPNVGSTGGRCGGAVGPHTALIF